jgi:hypothetical protein
MSIVLELHMGTYIDDIFERAEDSSDGTEEDTLQKTRLANDNLEQVLVNGNELDSVSGLNVTPLHMDLTLTSAKASQTFCSSAALV